MSQPPAPMGQEQQRQIITWVGQALAAGAPQGWQQLVVDYRAVGRHIEVDVILTGPDGIPRIGRPMPDVLRQLANLRSGMYQPGRGTWFGVTLMFTPNRNPHVEFVVDQEPRWRQAPPPLGFQDELRFFPRSQENVPGWLAQRAAQPPQSVAPQGTAPQGTPPPGTPPQGTPVQAAAPATASPAGDRIRSPKVFDGLDEAGSPVVDREPLPGNEKDAVLGYLNEAPVVLASRSYAEDILDAERGAEVPMNFCTDGVWVWPGAVSYYLREHDLAPDPELLAHIRRQRHTLPEVGEEARGRAVEALSNGEA